MVVFLEINMARYTENGNHKDIAEYIKIGKIRKMNEEIANMTRVSSSMGLVHHIS